MKLKTSCCKTALKKDMTRFWPVWVGYSLCLLCGMLLLMSDGLEYSFPYNMAALPQVMGIIIAGYGLLVAQVLFGDLYNPRLCYGVHSLPLKRENWFAVHICAGLLFNLIPSVIMAAVSGVCLCFSNAVDGWQIALWWLLAINLQYLFFFGTAVLAVMLSGNRMGGTLVYGMVQLGMLLVWFLAETVYRPLLYGVVLRQEDFLILSPVVWISDTPFLDYSTVKVEEGLETVRLGYYSLTGDWWYLWVIAAVGAAAAALALWCYKKRSLERAGDLMITRKLNPIFQVVFALACCGFFQFVVYTLLGIRDYVIFLSLGLIMGWFAGSMLVRRSTRVFRLRSFLALGALALVLGGSIWLTAIDIFGIARYIPQAQDIKSVKVSQGLKYGDNVTLTDPGDIEKALQLHGYSLERSEKEYQGNFRYDGQVMDHFTQESIDEELVEYPVDYQLTYTLKSGRTVIRDYRLWVSDPEGPILQQFMSRPEVHCGKADFRMIREPLTVCHVDGKPVELAREELDSLLLALQLDAEKGALAQDYDFHRKDFQKDENGTSYRVSIWLDMEFGTAGETEFTVVQLTIFPDAQNTWQWFRETGLLGKYAEYGQ